MPKRSETRRSETGTKYKKGEESMKVYKKLMNALAAVEKVVLVVTTLLILVPVSYTHLDVYKRQR